jgi:hypothetical protein
VRAKDHPVVRIIVKRSSTIECAVNPPPQVKQFHNHDIAKCPVPIVCSVPICTYRRIKFCTIYNFTIFKHLLTTEQDCQMVYFQTKNPILGKFFRGLQLKGLAYFMSIWHILRRFGIIYGHLVYFWLICIFSTVLVSITEKNLATLPQSGADCSCFH